MSTSVAFEPGVAIIAGTRYAIRDVGTHGEIQLGAEDGIVLRPLTYGERARIVGRLAGAPNTVDAVGAAVLRAATTRPGSGDQTVAEILALVLAGANADAPPFATTLLTVAGAAGWSLRDIDEADAETIDQLAMQLGAVVADPDDGWSRIVLVDDAQATSLDDVRRELAERLITRAGAVANVTTTPETSTAAQDQPLPTTLATIALPSTLRFDAVEHTVSQPDWTATPSLDSAPSAPELGGGQPSAPNSPGRQPPTLDTPRRLLGVTGTSNPTPAQRVHQAATAEVRPKFRLLGSANRAAAAAPAMLPNESAPVRPLNRVSYQPDAGAAQRSLNPQPLPPKQPLNTAPALELVRAPQSATPITLPTPSPAPVEATRLTGWNDAPADESAPAVGPTLAQIATLVGDEVADALAALLDHEADLRGIDR